MCADHSILPQGQPVERMTSLLHGGHVRLRVNFMSWSNFCVLVWLSLPWRDFITLSDIIRICGHVMYDVILYGGHVILGMIFSPSWMKFSSWWDFVCLGVILHLGAINRILVWFSFVLDTIFVLVRFYFFWCRWLSWWYHTINSYRFCQPAVVMQLLHKLKKWPHCICVYKMQVNTLRPRQNGRHFPDGIFKYTFLNENVWISIKISLKFVPKGPINNIPSLVQIMAWHRPGDKPLSERIMVSLLTHICVTRPQWVKTYALGHKDQGQIA